MALFDLEDLEEEEDIFTGDEEQEDDEDISIPREYAIDFDTGQLKTPRQYVEGAEALKVWAWLALQTPRYRYEFYPWEYGSDLETLIGTGYSPTYERARVEKILTDCLLANEHITGISDLVIAFDDSTLYAAFTMITDCGEVEMAVAA